MLAFLHSKYCTFTFFSKTLFLHYLNQFIPVIGSREGISHWYISLGMTSEIYLLERVLWVSVFMVTSELR
jgi:hypothetical protein